MSPLDLDKIAKALDQRQKERNRAMGLKLSKTIVNDSDSPTTIRMALGQEDFQHLVKGGTLVQDKGFITVEIYLNDIGLEPMIEAVTNIHPDQVGKIKGVGKPYGDDEDPEYAIHQVDFGGGHSLGKFQGREALRKHYELNKDQFDEDLLDSGQLLFRDGKQVNIYTELGITDPRTLPKDPHPINKPNKKDGEALLLVAAGRVCENCVNGGTYVETRNVFRGTTGSPAQYEVKCVACEAKYRLSYTDGTRRHARMDWMQETVLDNKIGVDPEPNP